MHVPPHPTSGRARDRLHTQVPPTKIQDGLTLVRAATRRLHARVENESLLSAVISGEVSHAGYALILVRLSHLYTEVDRVLLLADRHRPAALSPYCPRAPRLIAESRALGYSAAANELPRLPEPTGNGGYLGVRYVVDGAHFGNRLIARTLVSSPLARLLPPDSFWNTPFVAPEDWRGLCRQLENIEDRNQLADAARSARGVFWHFRRHLALA